jgi:hypothetical protein
MRRPGISDMYVRLSNHGKNCKFSCTGTETVKQTRPTATCRSNAKQVRLYNAGARKRMSRSAAQARRGQRGGGVEPGLQAGNRVRDNGLLV